MSLNVWRTQTKQAVSFLLLLTAISFFHYAIVFSRMQNVSAYEIPIESVVWKWQTFFCRHIQKPQKFLNTILLQIKYPRDHYVIKIIYQSQQANILHHKIAFKILHRLRQNIHAKAYGCFHKRSVKSNL